MCGADDNKENNKLINSEQKHAENIANNEHRGGQDTVGCC